MKVGIFGGTFDPVHYGHLRAAEEVREELDFDKILFIPAGNPPLKRADITEAKHRYEMAGIALLGNPFFELSDIECRLPEKSYTVKTVDELKKNNPGTEFFLILGIDAFLDIPNWWHPERLIALANFVVISRPDFRFIDLQGSPYMKTDKKFLKNIDNSENGIYKTDLSSKKEAFLLKIRPISISSTEIRRLIRQGKSIKYLLPPEVQYYIITNKLYKN